MLQTEFETLTGIFPDAILYEVIEREYNRQTEDGRDFWDNKHDFCNAYKFNEDGLASRLQAAANEAIWRKEEAHRKAMQESAERIEKLSRELHDRKAYCEMLEEQLRDRQQEPGAVLEETAPDIKSQMLDALIDALHDDAGSKAIYGILKGFEYLLIVRSFAG